MGKEEKMDVKVSVDKEEISKIGNRKDKPIIMNQCDVDNYEPMQCEKY